MDGRLELSWSQVLNTRQTKVFWTADFTVLAAGVECRVVQSVVGGRLRLPWSQVLKARRTKVFWQQV